MTANVKQEWNVSKRTQTKMVMEYGFYYPSSDA